MNGTGEAALWDWIAFALLSAVLLVVDLFAHRRHGEETRRTAFIWSGVWIAVGLAFGFYVWVRMDAASAQEYLAAYLIEKSLSLDNLFVFLIIFQTLQIPRRFQRRALLWGILGAVVFRALFIFLGVAAVRRWQWVEYIFAAILLYAAWHAFRENPMEPKRSRIVGWLSHRFRVTENLHGAHFLVRENDRWQVTPLLIAVLALELTDIAFAVDSIPAAFAVTRREFLIYSSNIFAILGLRALYIALVHTLTRLRYLHYGLAAVLAFAAAKMIAARWHIEVHPLVSVAVIVCFIGTAVTASLVAPTDDSDSGGSAEHVE